MRQLNVANKTANQTEQSKMADRITQIDVPVGATDIIIFVHGFGVRYDSRGMFTDIKQTLPKNFGSIMFDFNKVSDKDVYLSSIKEQVEILRGIIENAKTDFPGIKLSVVAHSMGCIITSLAGLNIDGKVIFLAPPDNFGDNRLESYFRHYDGASENNNMLIVPRKDGSISHIPLDFFNEMATIQPIEAMLSYAKTKMINIIQTTRDEVIGATDYGKLSKFANISTIPSDHNFNDSNREAVIEKLATILQK